MGYDMKKGFTKAEIAPAVVLFGMAQAPLVAAWFDENGFLGEKGHANGLVLHRVVHLVCRVERKPFAEVNREPP